MTTATTRAGMRRPPCAIQQPILEVLRRVLPAKGSVLEIGSGSGQHVTAFARELPGLVWQPSDVAADNLASIAAWGAEAPQPNLRAPLRLDAARPPWPGVEPASFDAVLSINVIHIAPWAVCQGLVAGRPRRSVGRAFSSFTARTDAADGTPRRQRGLRPDAEGAGPTLRRARPGEQGRGFALRLPACRGGGDAGQRNLTVVFRMGSDEETCG